MTRDSQPGTGQPYAANPAARPRLARIGREATPLIVIDDALVDTLALVERGRVHDGYGPDGTSAYPGVRARLPEAYVTAILQPLLPMLYRAFDLPAGAEPKLLNAVFSLVATPAGRLSVSQRVPHYDSLAPGHLAILHYLADGHFGGTGFFRHRPTGFERLDASRKAEYLAAGERHVAEHGEPAGYIQGTTDHYELVEQVDYRPNRLLVYPGSLLHSGLVDPVRDIDDDPATGRLTANIFLEFR